jgi:hypothetical protein
MIGSIAGRPRVPAPVYFSAVALVTALGIAVAMLLRPAFAHAVLQLTGLENTPQAKPDSFYAVRVAPLLDAHCASCHGAGRQKAQLRLDSFAATMRGGKHGAVINPGDVKDSLLFARIILPVSDDKAMPPSGKAPLSRDDVTVIRLWIAAGASGAQPVNAIKGAPALVLPVTIPEINPAAVQKQRAALASQVNELQGCLPGIISYEARDSANLEINAALKGAAFGDSDLRALFPLRDRIVRADFSGTTITDASAQLLASMKSLQLLRLTNTKTTDATIRALAPLASLKSLMVTKAAPATLASLRRRGIRVYESADVR